jgi:adenylosuccinate lyase
VERGIGPDATIHLDFALHRLAGVVEKLVIYPERMKANLDLLGGLHNSQRVLLALTQAGVSREDAYRLVQRNAMAVWRMPAPRPATALIDALAGDADVSARLPRAALEPLFDDGAHLAHVDTIFARVFGA